MITHSGPGTLNALISVAYAYKDSSPMICISGAVKRKLKGTGGMLEADHRHVFAPLSARGCSGSRTHGRPPRSSPRPTD